MNNPIDKNLTTYIEREILPRYDHFDAAHQRNHAEEVIARSLALAEHYEVNINMVYAIAAYHDTGLSEGRETHHLVSGRIIREDRRLRDWFDKAQIETMAQAAGARAALDLRQNRGRSRPPHLTRKGHPAHHPVRPRPLPRTRQGRAIPTLPQAPFGEIFRHGLSPPLAPRIGERATFGGTSENHPRRNGFADGV